MSDQGDVGRSNPDADSSGRSSPTRREKRPLRGRFVRALEILSSASILFAVVAFVSEYSYRHIERTERSIQLLTLVPPQSEAAAMALEYLNRDISIPLCPFTQLCSIRPPLELRDLDLYDKADKEGVVISRRNLSEAKIEKSDLRGIVFNNVNLERASFRDTDLRGSRFNLVDLECTQFVNTDLSGATITFNSLNGAEFLNANISDVTFEIAGQAFFDGTDDTRTYTSQMQSAGMYPETLSGAWAWKGHEPRNLPEIYQTYFVCENDQPIPENASLNLPSGANCKIKYPENIKQLRSCAMQTEESPVTRTMDWVGEKFERAKSLFNQSGQAVR